MPSSNFLSNPALRQTDTLTNKQISKNITFLAKAINKQDNDVLNLKINIVFTCFVIFKIIFIH